MIYLGHDQYAPAALLDSEQALKRVRASGLMAQPGFALPKGGKRKRKKKIPVLCLENEYSLDGKELFIGVQSFNCHR